MSINKALLALAIASVATGAQAAVGYQFDGTTFYQFGSPANVANNVNGSPDSGFFTIANNGSSNFTGEVDVTAQSVFSGDFSFQFKNVVLNAGQSITLGVNSESSNQGGYNPAGPGLPQNGVLIDLNGTVTQGANSQAVGLFIYDKDVHSGVFNLAAGVPSDSYVLQGGSPFGVDTTDAFEVTDPASTTVHQSPGHWQWVQAVPEPQDYALMALGLVGIAAIRRRKAA